MSEQIEDEGEVRGGRYYPKLTKREHAFIKREAKRYKVTPNQMLEAMMLNFFRTHDSKAYERMKQIVDPKALALVTDKQEWLKEHEMIEVTVRLYKPFHEFIKEYIAFFGSKQSIEDLCRSMIYLEVQTLYEELQGKPYIDEGEWFDKWSHIAITAFKEPEEEDC